MPLQRSDLIVRDARLQSGDKFYSSTAGVRLSEWQRYLNEVQTAIFQKILNTHASVFNRQIVVPVTSGSANVPIPATNPNAVNLKGNIINVSYSFDGNPQNYYKLNLRSPSQEISYPAYPEGYFLRDGQIVLTPIPNQPSGMLRIDFQYDIPALDVRRAKLNVNTTNVGQLVFLNDATIVTETEDDISNGLVDYMSVVDRDGVILAQNVLVVGTVYNRSTKVLPAILTAENITAIQAAVDAWAVFGSFTTTHSQLPDNCLRYVTHGLSRFVQMRDSNSEVTVTKEHLKELEDEIVASFADLEEDTTPIPILDRSFIYEL